MIFQNKKPKLLNQLKMRSESKFSRRDFLKVSALGAAGALLMPSGLAAAAKSKKNEKLLLT